MILRPITLLAMIVSIVTGVALGIAGYGHWRASQIDHASLAQFESVLHHVRQNYVEEMSDEALLSGALNGMLQSLDPHSVYLEASEFEDLQAETTGHFGGIGIELGLIDGYFTVISPIDNTPAARAGLRSGDRILEIDQVSLRGESLIEVLHKMRGEPGTRIKLKYRHPSSTRIKNVTLKRETIAVESVRGRWLEPGYLYLRISQFQTTTGQDFQRAINKLGRASEAEIAGLVLDLRNNPGGVLQASVAVADALLDDGLIVYTEGRLPSSKLKYRAAGKDVLKGAPIAVLINHGSASASEIVAGALKDHGRATLIGETSYGKGSVQSLVPLNDERAIKLTTAYYYTPSGRSIHKLGIEPDVEFPDNGEHEDFDQALLTLAVSRLKQSPQTPGTAATEEELQAQL
ncbi:MAG: S41 family peptidase [Pseudomonadales bacterium]